MEQCFTVETISYADFGSVRLSSGQQGKFVLPSPPKFRLGGMSNLWYLKKVRLAYGLPWEKLVRKEKEITRGPVSQAVPRF